MDHPLPNYPLFQVLDGPALGSYPGRMSTIGLELGNL